MAGLKPGQLAGHVKPKEIPVSKGGTGTVNEAGKLLGSSEGLLGGLGFGSLMSVGFGVMDFMDAKNEGVGNIEALASAGMNFIVPELVGGWAYAGYQALSMAGQLGVSAYENANMSLRQMNRDLRNQTPFRGHTFVDSPQIYTMRQAGMALAQQSKYNLQQTMMGNEAQFLHR